MYGFGNRLKHLRKKKGFSQKALAQRICKRVSAVSSYESEAQIPPVEVLVSIATVLNVSLDYLVGFETDIGYSTKGLSKEQVDFLDALFREFQTVNNSTNQITRQQMDLIEMLLQLLLSKPKQHSIVE